MVIPGGGNEILPVPTISQENINQEFLCVKWEDIMCISGFVVDDLAISEETPWPKGPMRFLNEYKGKFQGNERDFATSGFGASVTAAGIPLVCSSPLHNSRGY